MQPLESFGPVGIHGTEVNEFERKFAHYCSVSEAVGVANGLDAQLVLRAWKEMGLQRPG